MNIHEALAYGKRGGFVYLRYTAIVFFFNSQVVTAFVILNALNEASNALLALEENDVAGIVTAITSFKIDGPWGTVLSVMRNLGCLVIPMYFVATISFALNLNRGGIERLTCRTALIAVIVFLYLFL